MEIYIWMGIVLCLSQSAILSGLNLAYFSVSTLRLELEIKKNNKAAIKIMKLRKDSNFLLVTILWANVGINVLLALLSDSVMAGVSAFVFSTVLITIIGEIIPQAYFSRHAIKMGAILVPVLRFYQLILFLVAKPTALVLDRWLGKEAIIFFKERDLKELIKMHSKNAQTEIAQTEGMGAINFLSMDDISVMKEGELIDHESIIQLPFEGGKPIFPPITISQNDPFLYKVQKSGKKWAIILNEKKQPKMVINTDKMIREAFFQKEVFDPVKYCHRPIIIRDPDTTIGEILPQFKVHPMHSEDDVIDHDIVLVWNETKRVITGSDLLGRLLRGIVQNKMIQKEDEMI